MRCKSTVWVISQNDRIPGETYGYEHGIELSKKLSDNGYHTSFITSNWSHSSKKWRDLKPSNLQNLKFSVELVKVTPYKKNISFWRLFNNLIFAFGISSRLIKSKNRPEIIFLPLPALFLDVMVAYLAKRYEIKVISDLRDLYPELFERVYPPKGIFKVIYKLFYLARQYCLRNSFGCTSVCNEYLDICRNINTNKRFAIIYSSSITNDILENYSVQMIDRQNQNFLYAGNFGEKYDLENLISAFQSAWEKKPTIRLHLAGNGPFRSKLKLLTNNFNDQWVVYHGELNKSELSKLYEICIAGFAPYDSDTTIAIPAKAFDFLCFDITCITNLQTEIKTLLDKHSIGVYYDYGNAESLTKAILKVALNPRTKKRKRFEYTSENIYNNVLNLFQL